MENILFVTAHFPYPIIGGERVKEYAILKHLAQNYNVTLVSLDRGYPVTIADISEIEKLGIKVHFFKINKIKAYFKGVLNFFSASPLEPKVFINKKLIQFIDELIKTNDFSIVINFFLRTAELIRNNCLPKILILDDCRSFYQKRTGHASKNIIQKIIRLSETKKLVRYESKLSEDFDSITFVSDIDMNNFPSYGNQDKLVILPHPIDTIKFSPIETLSPGNDLLFSGKLDMWVNRIIVKRLINEIYPLIRQHKPDIRLLIVGSNPTKGLLKNKTPGVEIIGNVESMVPYLRRAAVFINPHLGGSGIQNKVLEAMACACPVVATPSGLAGIEAVHGENCMIAQNNEEFVSHTIRLLNNPALRTKIGMNARETIIKNHHPENFNISLDQLINQHKKRG